MDKQFMVTLKLPKNPAHNPHNKITGPCPVNDTKVCTDSTGEHHTVLYSAPDFMSTAQSVVEYWKLSGYHVTRVEEV
jgi:hypothetical protein